LIGSVLIPLLIGGLRYGVGTDYVSYYTSYQYEDYINPGFFAISSIARYFDDYHLLFSIYNFLTILFTIIGIKNLDNKYRPIAYVCYLFLFFTMSFNAMRQMLAVSVLFASYKYAISKKPVVFILMVFLASFFHTTALVGIALYPLLNIKKKKTKALFMIVALFAVMNMQNILNTVISIPMFEHFSMYSEQVIEASFSNASIFIEIAIFIFLLYIRSNVKDKETFNKYLFIYAIGIVFLLIGFSNPYVKRIAYYFIVSIIALLPMSSYSINDNKRRHALQIAILLYVVARFVIQVYVLGQSSIIPYVFMEL
jgi:hypothetical protein